MISGARAVAGHWLIVFIPWSWPKALGISQGNLVCLDPWGTDFIQNLHFLWQRKRIFFLIFFIVWGLSVTHPPSQHNITLCPFTPTPKTQIGSNPVNWSIWMDGPLCPPRTPMTSMKVCLNRSTCRTGALGAIKYLSFSLTLDPG